METDGLRALFERCWPCLIPELAKDYWSDLQAAIAKERRHHTIYPARGNVFRALAATCLEDVKAVIVGQDPYAGEGQADGLCFSVPCGERIPPSLRNIYRELRADVNVQPPDHGNLDSWASQGVLLLNRTLTVRAGQPGAMVRLGWETFTGAVIACVDEKPDRVVFLMWGKEAQRAVKLIDTRRHTVLCSSHPAPLAARRGCNPFLGSRPFSRANLALRAAGREEVDWSLPVDCGS
jgi:uracil-DNA glycosylase